MALLPPLRRFMSEDFPDAPSWLPRFFYPLNRFMGAVYSALNQGLTFNNNMIAQIKTLSITAGSSSPVTQFTWSFSTSPVGCLVISTTDISSTPAVVTNAVTIDWGYGSGVVTINNITGLTAGKTYSITFLVIGG